MHDTQECGSWYIARQAANNPAVDVHDKCIPKALVHKGNSPVIGRDIRPLAKMGKDRYVFRQMLQRTANFSLPINDYR
jgi:hypothetical protein